MTLSTSVRNRWNRRIIYWLLFTAFVALFGAVYERFSHEVYSYHMIYAFAFPLILGLLPCSIIALRQSQDVNSRSVFLWNCSVIVLTVGSLFQGVLEIYGISSVLVLPYAAAGILLLAAGIITGILKRDRTNTENDSDQACR